jgi:hypothetical protein
MSTMSRSRRKRPITASSRSATNRLLAVGLAAALAVTGACRGGTRERFVTYFNADQGLTVRYPASWTTQQAEQDGLWYRSFLAPPSGPDHKPAVSVTLLAGPLEGSLEDRAQTYLAGNTVLSSRDEPRQGARAKWFVFASPDMATRQSLLLIEDRGRVYGLYSQGESTLFERHFPIVEEMSRSLTIERAESYPLHMNKKLGFSIRVPASWPLTRSFSGAGTTLTQFTSPPLAADKGGQTVHASLTVTVEPVPGDRSLETFYTTARAKQGDSFQVVSHKPWRSGYVDVLQTETPLAMSRVRRYFRVEGAHGYSLAFEAREDVFHRVSPWCEMIAETLRIGAEAEAQ